MMLRTNDQFTLLIIIIIVNINNSSRLKYTNNLNNQIMKNWQLLILARELPKVIQ